MKINAISVIDPYAYLLGLGIKRYETRSRYTHYRGDIAICVSKRRNWITELDSTANGILSRIGVSVPDEKGTCIAIARLTDCHLITEEFIAMLNQEHPDELLCGLYTPGRYAWEFSEVRMLSDPIPVRGFPGMFTIEINEEVL